nr:MAG TPA: hypothetical protein [Caudoviricetes sp.]DAN12363.1 MAG TPA: hypothetical protein [Caudoviricetes sp.]DAP60944.1 MAG TPA: hypothetical protein [Caudoviricetes sp.]
MVRLNIAIFSIVLPPRMTDTKKGRTWRPALAL